MLRPTTLQSEPAAALHQSLGSGPWDESDVTGRMTQLDMSSGEHQQSPSSSFSPPTGLLLKLPIVGRGSMLTVSGGSESVGIRPQLSGLEFNKPGVRKNNNNIENERTPTSGGYTWPAVGDGSGSQLDMIRSHSSGRLKFSPKEEFEFSADDLVDLGEIGQGAFGTVSKMMYKRLNTTMAVKRIRSTMDKNEERGLLMDLNVIMSSDECPFIVKFYGAIFKEGDCWICMELMDTSLEKLYKSVFERLGERMPEDIIGKVAVATVRALKYLKDKLKIIHRDVKPSNILLDRKGHIKLCDFGIAGQLVDSMVKTRDAGCRPYMAPEKIDPQKNHRGYDVRSDVWSLGITMYEISTGKFPYPEWKSVFDQLHQVVDGDPPLLNPTEYPEFSVEFIQFVNACLTKDETHRPKYDDILEKYKFIKDYCEKYVDVATFVTRVLNSTSAGQYDDGPIYSGT